MPDSTRQSVLFAEGFERPLVAAFDADAVTSDGGAPLLRAADRRLGLTSRLADCVADSRDPGRVTHGFVELVRQRVYSIALGYPCANAAERLCDDPALGLAVRGRCGDGRSLASQPTLSRLENAPTARELLAMGDVLLDSAVEAIARRDPRPRRVVIDLDPSVDPAHGEQQGVLFNGFYRTHCYLPVLGFASVEGRAGHHLFMARLRGGHASAWQGTRRPLRKMIRALRARFPKARVLVRLDAAFGRGPLFEMLEAEGVEYAIGMIGNSKLQRMAAKAKARTEARAKRGEAEPCEVFVRRCRAGTWRRRRRLVVRVQAARADGTPAVATARFIVTNVDEPPKRLYSRYCGRGDAENRIKELKDDLEMDRTSCSRFCANQLRVTLTAAAYVLMQALREKAAGTEFETAQTGRLRMALLRVGGRVIRSVRRVVLHLAESHPWAAAWRRVALGLGAVG